MKNVKILNTVFMTATIFCLVSSGVTAQGQTDGKDDLKREVNDSTGPSKRHFGRVSFSEFKEAVSHVNLNREAGHGKIQVFATQDSLRFLDERGGIRKSIPLTPRKGGSQWSKVYGVRGNKYVGVNEVLDYDGQGEAVKDGRFKMFDINGNLLWEVKHDHYNFLPSPSGQSAIAEADPACGSCPLTVYGKDGVIRNIPKPYRGFSVAFSKDGAITALSTFDRSKKTGYLTLFDKEWAQLWQKESSGSIGNLGMADDGNYIGATYSNQESSKRWARVFNTSGTLVMEYEIGTIGTYQWLFSEDGKRALAGTDGNNIYCFDLHARKLLWHYKTQKKEMFKHRRLIPGQETETITYEQKERGRFRALVATPNLDFIVLADTGYGELDDYLYLLDAKGQPILIENLGKDYFYTQDNYLDAPIINIAPDGSRISVVSKQGVASFENPLASSK